MSPISWVLGGLVLTLALLLAVGWRLGLRLAGRLERIVESGNLGDRLHLTTVGPFAAITRAVNRLLALVQERMVEEARRGRARRQLVADVSHDLRTPLTSVLGYVRAIREGRVEEPGAALEIVEDKAQGLHHMVDQLFYLARLEAGDLELQKQEVDLGELVRRVAAGCYRDFEESGTRLELDLPSRGPRLRLDPRAFTRLLQNLLDNVREHAPGATRAALHLTTEGTRAVLTVADDGPGLPAANPEELLQRGSHHHSARGLGLPLVARLARAQGGWVKLAASSEGGTAVTVYLPLSDAGGSSSS